jgi:hypothetical protein
VSDGVTPGPVTPTPTVTTSPVTNSGPNHKPSLGVIIGCAIAGSILLGLLTAALCWFLRRRRRQRGPVTFGPSTGVVVFNENSHPPPPFDIDRTPFPSQTHPLPPAGPKSWYFATGTTAKTMSGGNGRTPPLRLLAPAGPNSLHFATGTSAPPTIMSGEVVRTVSPPMDANDRQLLPPPA